MTYYVHVNRQTIDRNRKHGLDEPPVCYRKGRRGKAVYAHEIELVNGRVKYSAHTPLLPCGARLVIETDEEPKVIR